MEPVIPNVPTDVNLVFEYSCEYDYSKSQYLGKSLFLNSRIEAYGLNNKVQNVNLLSGATVILDNKFISDKINIKITDEVSNKALSTITSKIYNKLSKYSKFSEYCKDQIIYSRLDPVVTENAIRNGRIKGVYNTVDSYDAEGGVLYQLNQLSDLSGSLTYPKTDQLVRYYLCGRSNGKIGESYSQIFVTLGYNSKLTLNCNKFYNDFQE
jgi:hypothetical protein